MVIIKATIAMIVGMQIVQMLISEIIPTTLITAISIRDKKSRPYNG